MKRTILFLFALAFYGSSIAQDLASNTSDIQLVNINTKTNIKWTKEIHNFGEFVKDQSVTAVFEFKNTGDKPLIISKVVSSCGCTTTNYANEPLMPGKSSKITVTFNVKRPGAFNKAVKVYSNSIVGEKLLKIKGKVI